MARAVMVTKFFASSRVAIRDLRPWLMWLTSAYFALFQFFLQLSSGVMVGDMMREFTLTTFGAGALTAVYYYIYFALQTPAGMLIDRYGVRLLLTAGSLVCGFGCLLFAMAHSLYLAFFARILMGGGAAFAFISSLHIIRHEFSPSKHVFMISLTETLGMLLTLMGTIFLASVIKSIGWRESMMVNFFILMLIAFASYHIIRDRQPIGTTDEDMITFKQGVKTIIGNWRIWLNGLYAGLVFSVATVFAALWAIPFFLKDAHLSLTQATAASSMLYAGIALGGPVVAYVHARIRRSRPILISASLISTCLMTMILSISNPPAWLLFSLTFTLGMSTSAYLLCYIIAGDLAPSRAKSTSTGFTNALCILSAPVLQPLVGYFLYRLALNHSVGDMIDYTLSDYRYALLIMPALLLVATVIAFFIPETRR